jgi:hypothetical protein
VYKGVGGVFLLCAGMLAYTMVTTARVQLPGW